MSWRHMGEWRYSSAVLDLSTRWRWVVSFMPQPLYPQVKSPHWIEGWMGSRAALGAVKKMEISCPCRQSNPGRPDNSLVTMLTIVPISCYWCTCPMLQPFIKIVHFLHIFSRVFSLYDSSCSAVMLLICILEAPSFNIGHNTWLSKWVFLFSSVAWCQCHDTRPSSIQATTISFNIFWIHYHQVT
jgi:hypothetical protein